MDTKEREEHEEEGSGIWGKCKYPSRKHLNCNLCGRCENDNEGEV